MSEVLAEAIFMLLLVIVGQLVAITYILIKLMDGPP